MRSIAGEQTAPVVALELLNELTQPGIRDLNVEFRGLQVAAMYPERLPNLAAGMQQILVGRYLPTDESQQGEVVVTGKRGSETVRYAAHVSFAQAEAGNSFIPRLWARSHLDHLLQQGQAEDVKNNIIGLSEEFHIISPYTSLLVLETDADRERFGVKRRYEMRDGEQFFAQGRDNANYELLQQQMKRAGDWRIALRGQVLRGLASIGRDARMLPQQLQVFDQLERLNVNGHLSLSNSVSGPASPPNQWDYSKFAVGGMGGGGGSSMRGSSPFGEFQNAFEYGFLGDAREMKSEGQSSGERNERGAEELALGLEEGEKRLDQAGVDGPSDMIESFDSDGFSLVRDSKPGAFEPAMPAKAKAAYFAHDFESNGSFAGGRLVGAKDAFFGNWQQPYPDYTSWLNMLFPPLASPSESATVVPAPKNWTPEATALSQSLSRKESLLKLTGGLEVKRIADTFDPAWKRRSSHNADLALYVASQLAHAHARH